MKTRVLPLLGFILICILCVLIFNVYRAQQTENNSLNALTFENTQEWDPYLLAVGKTQLPFTSDELSTIQLPPPPANSSKEAQDEIQNLKEQSLLRNADKLQEIEREKLLETAVFGTSTFQELVNETNRPYTFALFEVSKKFTEPIIIREKQKFNRVRPSYLDPTLTIAIDIPKHAAYPSGHATQSHLYAEILTILNPSGKDEYQQSAERISTNREIAGVHYKSDSEAGKILSSQLLFLLLATDEFMKLLELAKSEWQ
jgi:hypothetical protein